MSDINYEQEVKKLRPDAKAGKYLDKWRIVVPQGGRIGNYAYTKEDAWQLAYEKLHAESGDTVDYEAQVKKIHLDAQFWQYADDFAIELPDGTMISDYCSSGNNAWKSAYDFLKEQGKI